MHIKLSVVLLIGACIGIDTLILTPIAKTQGGMSSSFCRDYAHRYASRYASGGAWSGAGQGAAVGAGIGAIANGGRGASRGAAIGAGMGAIGGGTRRAISYDRLFQQAYENCRWGRWP